MRQINSTPLQIILASFWISILLGACSISFQSRGWQNAFASGAELLQAKRYLDAEKSLKEAVSLCSQSEPESEGLATCLATLGLSYMAQSRYAEAENSFSQALQIFKKHDATRESIPVLSKLGDVYREEFLFDKAETTYNDCLRLEQKFGIDCSEIQNNLGQIASVKGNYQTAERYYKLALSNANNKTAREPDSYPSILNNLANVYESEGRFNESEQLHNKALKLVQKSHRDDSTEVAMILVSIAGLYVHQAKYADAESLYQKSLRILEVQLGDGHPTVAVVRNNLGNLYREQHRYVEAENEYKRALQSLSSKYGENNSQSGLVLGNLANLYQCMNRNSEAEALYKRALELRKRLYGPVHPIVAESLRSLAACYRKEERFAEAEPLLKQSLEMTKKTEGSEHPDMRYGLQTLSSMYLEQARYDEAEAYQKRALEITERVFGSEHPLTEDSLAQLAAIYIVRGRVADAEPLLQRSLKIQQKLGWSTAGDTAVLNNLASLYQSEGRLKDAETLYKQTLSILQKVEPSSTELAQVEHNLASLYERQGRYQDAEPLYSNSQAIRLKLRTDPLGGRLFARMAVALSEHIAGVEPSIAKNLSRNSLQNTTVPNLIANIKRNEATFGKNSIETGEAQLVLALRMLSLGAVEADLARSGFLKLRPLVQETINSQTAIRTSKGLRPDVGNSRLSVYDSSVMMLALACLFQDRGAINESIIAANYCMRCLRSADISTCGPNENGLLLTLANFYSMIGQGGYAEDCLGDAIARARQLNNKTLLANGLLHLSRVKLNNRDYSRAVGTANQCISEIGTDTTLQPCLADALDVMAESYSALGNNADAFLCAKKAVEVRDSVRGADQNATLSGLIVLSEQNLKQKKFAECAKNLNRANSILNTASDLPAHDTLMSEVFAVSGDLELAQGNLDTARLWYSRARDINLRLRSLDFADNVNSIAKVDALQHNMDSAASNVLWASSYLSSRFDLSFKGLSFAEQCAFVELLNQQSDMLLTICTDQKSLPKAYDYLLRWKGQLIESLRQRTALRHLAITNSELHQLVVKLSDLQSRLKRVDDSNEDPVARNETLKLIGESESLEREISEQSGFALRDPLAKSGSNLVQHLLPTSEAIIDITEYTNIMSGHVSYAAIITSHGSVSKFIGLGDAFTINKAIADWRTLVSSPVGANRSFKIENNDPPQVSRDLRMGQELKSLTALRRLIWDPIDAALTPGIHALWLCPDSSAATIPWSMFSPDHLIYTVDSPREFALFKTTRKRTSGGAKTVAHLLLAAPIHFQPPAQDLPGTLDEFDSIKSIALKARIMVEPFLGTDATADKITVTWPKSRYVHFATHGFYSGSDDEVNQKGGRGQIATQPSRSLRLWTQARADLVGSRNPLVYSGLLLAPIAGKLQMGNDKLTADDIAGLDLQKCDLVTLSACETGLGKTMNGQGVLGLRSAILSAGANNVMMSLWKVDDEATSRLMTEFYSNLIITHLPPLPALRAAQNAVRKEKEWKDPYYWAGWIVSGDN